MLSHAASTPGYQLSSLRDGFDFDSMLGYVRRNRGVHKSRAEEALVENIRGAGDIPTFRKDWRPVGLTSGNIE